MAKEKKVDTASQTTGSKGFLGWIERVGNKLPHPFWMFVWIIGIVIVVSFITSLFGVQATDPGTGKLIEAENLLSGDGLRRFVQEMVTNFAHFAPLGLVLVMLMGVSVAEKSGLLSVVMRNLAFSVPKKIVLPVIFIIGACGNIGSDAGVVIVPPIAALIFMQMGLHPIAGLIAGYAGATAGFTANLVIAGTDVLLAGISTEVTSKIQGAAEVSATSNWYFMIISTLLLAIAGAFVVQRYTIPRTNAFSTGDGKNLQPASEKHSLTSDERKGLKHAGWAAIAYIIVILALTVPPNAPLRDQTTGGLVPSPFLRGLVPILFFMFAIPGYFYGRATGSIKQADDIIKFMGDGMKDLSGYIVLMLVVAQFINLFSWSNLDKILAINGAHFLESSGLTGPLMFTLFITLVAFINIFIGSGSAKWAMFAPVFIPMLYQLGYSPAFVQLMYRIGDSITNSISPLYVYFPLLLGWIRQYDKKIGIGTVMSLLIPYGVVLYIMWIMLLFVWFWLKLPIGVGEGIFL
ncbi:MAG: AbgT family transporter [Prolixibacteraceae bacterium]|jgi:aminobenzoyl-glutamate transport protein|nr:AbgT family transporter [Prolixibacteraceae bacterium]